MKKLIVINTIVFFLALIFDKTGITNGQLGAYLSVPSSIKAFALQPWSLITHAFYHSDDLFHLLGNMIFLYFYGQILLNLQSEKRFYELFFYGCLVGALLFLGVSVSFMLAGKTVQLGSLYGASAGVMSVAVATTWLFPNFELMLFGVFRTPIKWVTIAVVLLGFLNINVTNPGGQLAHLGGIIFGSIYAFQLQGRINTSIFTSIKNLFKPKYTVVDERDFMKKQPPKSKNPFVKVNENKANRANHSESGKTRKPNQDEIDAILDKINQSGYSSLTQDEKDILFRASE